VVLGHEVQLELLFWHVRQLLPHIEQLMVWMDET